MDTSLAPTATLTDEILASPPSPPTAVRELPAELAGFPVLGCLGSGGMADVFAVRAPDGAIRALKVLRAPRSAHVARVRREAFVQGRIRHPNVLGLVATLTHAGAPALLLPYVAGPTLAGLLADGPLAPPDADALFAQVVAGVGALHGEGFVHRDLKPANVLLDPTPEGLVVRIADLGLVKVRAAGLDATLQGALLGTPAYAAPEQLRDASSVDARADVWALGALWFELRTGARYERGAPVEGPALLRRLLAADPAERPADAEAVGDLLPPPGLPSAALLARCRALAPRWEATDAAADPSAAGRTCSLA